MGPSWENLGDFMQTDDKGGLATTALFLCSDGVELPVVGYFDISQMDRALGEYVPNSEDPRFTCQAADVAGVERQGRVRIGVRLVGKGWVGGEAYDVLEAPDCDGTGLAVIRLAKSGRAAPVPQEGRKQWRA